MTKRKFKIKIRGKADHYAGEGNATETFSDVVHDWWIKHGRNSLLTELNKQNLLDKSYLNNFRFDDDADDKETYH